MGESARVDELITRHGTEIDIGLNTAQEEALRLLASNPGRDYPPKSIADNTSIEASSVNKVMTQLYKMNLVDREKDRYSIPERLLPDIRGVLGDLHNLKELAGEPGQNLVHQEETIERDSKSNRPATDDEVEDLLDEF